MLKSLYSGVSGLQSHQVAMDVESNNIANVNTTGFKYSRANFSDLLAQTKAVATAPQGALGGKNPVQVGLGSTVNSTTTIFSQGSIQNSDKNTDVAIQGDGFFIVSPDGGNTYKYTRAGDFKFDANGNFTDNNGFIVQGWVRDPETGKIDSASSIKNINIPPGLTTPASPTSEVVLKANLNSGSLVKNFSPAYKVESGAPAADQNEVALDANGNAVPSGDLGVMFNDGGEAFSLQKDQGVWMSFLHSTSTSTSGVSDTLAATTDSNEKIVFTLDNGKTEPVEFIFKAGNDAAANALIEASAINAKSSITGITASVDSSNKIILVNTNANASASHNIQISSATGNTGFVADGTEDDVTAYKYQYDPAAINGGTGGAGSDKTFKTISDLRYQMEQQARDVDNDGISDNNNISVIVNEQGKIEISNPGGSIDDDYDINLAVTGLTANGITENVRFTRSLEALNSVLPVGSTGKAFSQSFNAATHSSSIDIFDSLGSKHTLTIEFRKTDVNKDTGIRTWDMKISVPAPATINVNGDPASQAFGKIYFKENGSFSDSTIPSVSFSANNGSGSKQKVDLNFGTSGDFDGMTSFDSISSTSGISQDVLQVEI